MQTSRFNTDRLERIDAWMRGHVAAQRLPGLAVQIARPDGEVVFSRRHGFADVGTQRPLDADAIYRIYSMTKPVTTLAALMLYEEGRFQLDQPVADFIPALASLRVLTGGDASLDETEPIARPVTVHDLMTHQAGFIYGGSGTALAQAYDAQGLDFDRPGDTVAAAVGRLAKLPLLFQPGARWYYGLSTDVLGHLVEVVSGVTLGAFFRDRIFAPLGMADTAFALPEASLPRLATLYAPASPAGGLKPIDTPFGVDPRQPVTAECGGAGLYSTMHDYQRFASMLLARGVCRGGRLLGRKTFDMMVTNQMGGDLASRGQSHFSETTMEGIGFGLGVSVMLDPARAKILGSPGEFAWGGLASTAFFVDPVEQFTVILMTQLIPSSAYTLRRQLRVLTYQALD